MSDLLRKPDWLRAKLPNGPGYMATRRNVDEHSLHTVCESAKCPNMGECWSRGTATVMILGNVCTRACTFCNIATGRPPELDLGEPARVADSIAKMNLKHVVITSVARDDLKDGGASVWAATVRAVHYKCPNTTVEILPADFRGKAEYLDIVLDAKPDIFNHNMETVERLQKPIRKTARYDRSLWVLEHAKSRDFITKSGIMLGIGEREGEIEQLLRDLRKIDVNILTIGQYLQPTKKHETLDRWVTPEEFNHWKQWALKLGFDVVESGPLVRSSYHADMQVDLFGLLEKRHAEKAAESA
ncbi:lipoyl synthase [Cerasicoccus arenae]|uniref:Lipoyl synthase n=1 Tax=Cerasicoccus arenae TaxID=424488 RepID=A0A8J3GC56_9BACT|nr:lipoyl synthase [Cerasicoccus arenae]MBK1859972.1 lipoyl synthase [Cerasicoccus arenae]GHB95796.1 lipoyl synthase [Cerasicoccus arenae]